MQINRMGLDIAKSIFQVHGVDKRGEPVVRRRLKRREVVPFFSKLSPCLVGMEAGRGAQYWARQLLKLGHEVRIMAAQYVRPYLKGGKNDANDAEAICEAVGRPSMRFVPIKSSDQQAIQALHRVRERLVEERTAKGNQIRGFLAEEGIVVPVGIGRLRRLLPRVLEDAENGLSALLREVLAGLYAQLCQLEQWVSEAEARIRRLFNETQACQRLATMTGVGPIIATALVAAVGDPKVFKNGRQFSAWLGLVPRQHSSGGRTQLGGITKRGDTYLRKLLVQGARAALKVAPKKEDPQSQWAMRLLQRRHKHITAVALANKMARIAWCLLRRNEDYRYALA